MIPLKDQDALKQRFARDLSSRVRVDYFTQKPSPIYVPGREECVDCENVRKLLHELAALNLRINLTQHDIEDEPDVARDMGIAIVPGIVLRGKANPALRYFGTPAGRQFATFVEMLLMTARDVPPLQAETVKTLRKLRSGVRLKVFVTPNCLHSPQMVLPAAHMALLSPNVSLDVIEVTHFPALVQRFYVRATPLTVFNDQYAIPGVIEEGNLAQDLLQTAQGQQPSKGGDPKKLTMLAPPQPQQQQRRPASSSGLILPR